MSQNKELAAFLNKMGSAIKFRIEESFGNGYVRLNIDESQRRQAKHDIRSVEDIIIEMVRNSRDAGARNIFVASRKRDNIREIWIIDDGCGIPSEHFERIFEARVTSKVEKILEDDYGVHGRGMALFAIKSRCKEAYVHKSSPNGLTLLKIIVDTDTLKEKADQSTFPKVKKTDGTYEFNGPRNIARIMTEFAFKHQDVNFYFGLPSQIAGTLVKMSKQDTTFTDFNITEGEEFLRIFSDYFGFDLSSRNSYRCLSGELKCQNIYNSLTGNANENRLKEKGLTTLFEQNDIDNFLHQTAQNLQSLAEKYNLEVTDKQLSKKGKVIKVMLSIEKAEEI